MFLTYYLLHLTSYLKQSRLTDGSVCMTALFE